MTSNACVLVFAIGAALVPAAVRAQTPPPCAGDSAYKALDFWVGEWDVLVDGKRTGSRRNERILKDCALVENWRAESGGEGKSLFYYQPATGKWKQVWITDNANARGGVKEKELIERLPGGALRFQGTIPLRNGGSYLDRTTLT